MSKVVLTKRWKNHPKGTALDSVSDGIQKELIKGKFADKPKVDKAIVKPKNKAILNAPKDKG